MGTDFVLPYIILFDIIGLLTLYKGASKSRRELVITIWNIFPPIEAIPRGAHTPKKRTTRFKKKRKSHFSEMIGSWNWLGLQCQTKLRSYPLSLIHNPLFLPLIPNPLVLFLSWNLGEGCSCDCSCHWVIFIFGVISIFWVVFILGLSLFLGSLKVFLWNFAKLLLLTLTLMNHNGFSNIITAFKSLLHNFFPSEMVNILIISDFSCPYLVC